MASFTNFATLIYNGGTSNSNTVTGELLETLTLTKTAASSRYTARDNVTYVLSLVNGGTAPLTELALTDNLGATPRHGHRVPADLQRGDAAGICQRCPANDPHGDGRASPDHHRSYRPRRRQCAAGVRAAVTRYAPLDQEAAITRVEEKIREKAGPRSKFSEILNPEDEKLMREVIREYLT